MTIPRRLIFITLIVLQVGLHGMGFTYIYDNRTPYSATFFVKYAGACKDENFVVGANEQRKQHKLCTVSYIDAAVEENIYTVTRDHVSQSTQIVQAQRYTGPYTGNATFAVTADGSGGYQIIRE